MQLIFGVIIGLLIGAYVAMSYHGNAEPKGERPGYSVEKIDKK